MTYITREKPSITSPIGVNSDNVISGGNWIVNTYTGAGEENDYAYVGVNLQVDEAGTLFFDFSQDGVNWSTFPVAGFSVVSGINEVHTAWKGGRYMRPRFVGTDGSRTFFRLKTYYSSLPLPLTAPLNQSISSDQDAQVVRAVLTGQNKAGNFKNVPVDSEGHLMAHLHDPKTAFGQLAVAEETTEIQVQFPLSINNRLFNKTEANGGTITSADSMAVLQTSTASNGLAILETKRAMRYQPGQGGVVRFTGVFTQGVPNSEQAIGYGDLNDGFFFGYQGVNFGIFRRQNGSQTFIPQSSFNQDVADGSNSTSNPSGMTLIPTFGNVFQIEFQWLGFGAVIFSIEDPNTGDYEPLHIIQYAGANTVPSIYNPTLPLHWEIVNLGNTTNLTLKSASAFAGIQGKRKITGPTFSYKKANSISTPHVFSIRNKATNVYGGTNTNRVRIYLKTFSIANDGTAASTIYTLQEDATLTGGTWVDVNTNDSVIEYNDTATISVNGTDLIPIVIPKNQGKTENIFDQLIELSPGQTFTITSSNANDSTILLSWVEDI